MNKDLKAEKERVRYSQNIERERARGRLKYQKNPEKGKANAKAYKSSHPEIVRDKYLLRTYGINLAQYNEMLKLQNHRCACCGADEVDLPRELVVDHNHKTNTIRELLCDSCNFAIGHLKDSSVVADRASNYLKKHGC